MWFSEKVWHVMFSVNNKVISSTQGSLAAMKKKKKRTKWQETAHEAVTYDSSSSLQLGVLKKVVFAKMADNMSKTNVCFSD